MTAPDSARMRYRPGLDGLRAVAVLLVLIFHVTQPHRFAGFVGVDIFFVLSGFLITSILLGEISASGTIQFGRFYVRRLLRLYPALLAMLVVVTPAFSWIIPSATPLIGLKDALIAATYTGNVYMTYRGSWLGPFTHTWSLALEEQYYLVWPLLLLVVLRGVRAQTLMWACVAAAVVTAALTVREFHYGGASYPLQSTTLGLFAGSALALGVKARVQFVHRLTTHRAGLAGAALLVALLVVFSATSALASGWFVVVSVVAGTLLVAAFGAGDDVAGGGRLGRLLRMPPVVGLGRISYGVYLWHYPIALGADRALGSWPAVARFVVVAPLSIAIAAASYRFVEKPFLRIKDRIRPDSERRMPSPADGTAASG
jgi:peptidoglycan/LPS O-acetylase OafA/YrhL